jgi:anhydro-N-acetylmuramic acid kinase
VSARASRLERLDQVARKPLRRIVGLMSGTSVDGVDAALVEVTGSYTETQVKLVAFETLPLERTVRERIHACFSGNVQQLCEANFSLGEVFAEAVLSVVRKANLPLDELDLVASHGQTVYHIDRSQGGVPSTLQIGEASIIAERTGALVVSDFRTRDIAAGGRGAPLVPYVDFCLFSKPGVVRALQNIGGIANVTVVPGPDEAERAIAFDTGPGNMILDEVAKELQDDDAAYDKDGQFSALGEVDRKLLDRLLSHPYFDLEPPKTTGREVFGVDYSRALIAEYDAYRLIDLMATVARFTAESIARAYRRFVIPRYKLTEAIVSGGGAHNKTLMRFLAEMLQEDGVAVKSLDDVPGVGFPGKAKEAVAFAILANETIQGLPSNLPAATGARRPVVLGKISL